MKTQIIQLNRNDDFISARDKMSWSQTGRILLVWPRRELLLDRRLDLQLLNRHASKMGAQLALLTRDAEVRFNAKQLGIPIFTDLRRAQESHWYAGGQKSLTRQRDSSTPMLEALRKIAHQQPAKWQVHIATRITSFAISVFSLFALGIFILPGARVRLTPQVKTQSMTLTLTADPSLTTINISTGSLPAYLQEVIVEGQDSINASGTAIIPDRMAEGDLKFVNISDHNITIPKGLIVATLGSNPVRFTTKSTNAMTVAPGKSITLAARAIEPGTFGNLPSGSLMAIEGDLGVNLTVTNLKATSGGTDTTISAPSEQDLESLRDRLSNQLKQAALAELQTLVPDGDTIITPSLILQEVLNETVSPGVGEPGDQLQILLRLKYQTQVVSGEVLRNMVMPLLDTNLSSGYSPVQNSLVITPLSNPTAGTDGLAHWTIRADRQIMAEISSTQWLSEVKGSSIQDANVLLLDKLPIAGEPEITLTPSWWPRLPLLPMRINVVQSIAP